MFWLLVVRAPAGGTARGQTALLAGLVYGAVILAVSGSTFWLIPYEAWNPARTVSLYLLGRGLVEFNLGVAAGLPPLVSLVPPLLACAVAFVAAVRGAKLRRADRCWPERSPAFWRQPPSSRFPRRPRPWNTASVRTLKNVLLPSMRAGWR